MPAYQRRVDQARPVIGNQPVPPGTTGLRYLSIEVSPMGLELVSAQPYCLETEYLSVEPIDHSQEMQLVELPTQGEGELGSLMLVQTPMRPRMPIMQKARPHVLVVEATIGCETTLTNLSLVTRGKDYLLLSIIVLIVVWTISPRCVPTNQP